MKKALFASAILFITANICHAQQPVQLSKFALVNKYSGVNYTGLGTDYSGQVWNNARLYDASDLELSGQIGFMKINAAEVLEIIVNFDFGKNSKALNAQPFIGIGGSYSQMIGTKTTIRIELQNVIASRGTVVEKPCTDEMMREFHCSTIRPWSDYKPINIINKFDPIINVTVTWYF